jgi:hypothetical protein
MDSNEVRGVCIIGPRNGKVRFVKDMAVKKYSVLVYWTVLVLTWRKTRCIPII